MDDALIDEADGKGERGSNQRICKPRTRCATTFYSLSGGHNRELWIDPEFLVLSDKYLETTIARTTVKMPFDSQFALSMEITRLVPLGGVINKATETVIKFARDLRVRPALPKRKFDRSNGWQNTGSDIMVEADLAEFFGRCRIARHMESSFRTLVAVSGGITDLCDGLGLVTTPGPTVSRSLKPGQEHYLSTVIQCSLLASVSGPSRIGSFCRHKPTPA